MPTVVRYALAHGRPVVVLTTFDQSPVSIRGVAAILALRLDSTLTAADSTLRLTLGADADPLRWGTLTASMARQAAEHVAAHVG